MGNKGIIHKRQSFNDTSTAVSSVPAPNTVYLMHYYPNDAQPPPFRPHTLLNSWNWLAIIAPRGHHAIKPSTLCPVDSSEGRCSILLCVRRVCSLRSSNAFVRRVWLIAFITWCCTSCNQTLCQPCQQHSKSSPVEPPAAISPCCLTSMFALRSFVNLTHSIFCSYRGSKPTSPGMQGKSERRERCSRSRS